MKFNINISEFIYSCFFFIVNIWIIHIAIHPELISVDHARLAASQEATLQANRYSA